MRLFIFYLVIIILRLQSNKMAEVYAEFLKWQGGKNKYMMTRHENKVSESHDGDVDNDNDYESYLNWKQNRKNETIEIRDLRKREEIKLEAKRAKELYFEMLSQETQETQENNNFDHMQYGSIFQSVEQHEIPPSVNESTCIVTEPVYHESDASLPTTLSESISINSVLEETNTLGETFSSETNTFGDTLGSETNSNVNM